MMSAMGKESGVARAGVGDRNQFDRGGNCTAIRLLFEKADSLRLQTSQLLPPPPFKYGHRRAGILCREAKGPPCLTTQSQEL